MAASGATCRSSEGTNPRTRPSSSAILSSDGLCDFDLTGDRADNVFFILGLRDTLGAREGDDQVEGFFCNETGVAELFRRRLSLLAAEQGIPDDTREQTTQECLKSFHSRVLAERLNSCYRYELRLPPHGPPSATAPRVGPVALNHELFYRGGGGGLASDGGLSETYFDRRRALAYLAGAWARHGDGRDFVFSSFSAVRAEFVASLLNNLGCRDIRIEHTVGAIPGATYVHFGPTDQVQMWLRKAW